MAYFFQKSGERARAHNPAQLRTRHHMPNWEAWKNETIDALKNENKRDQAGKCDRRD